jgi:hypothetical protein
MICQCCKKSVDENNTHLLSGGVQLCEDCYIDALVKEDQKTVAYNECKSSFLLRLKRPFDTRRVVSKDIRTIDFIER